LTATLVEMIREGTVEAGNSGVLQGYEMLDYQVSLIDVAFVDAPLNPLGYKIAATTAVRKAFQEAMPRLLEPIMSLEVVIPEDFTGEVIASINSRKGKVLEIAELHDRKLVRAHVPLRSMFGYSTELRSLTQGRGTFSMQYLRHDTI